MASAEGGSEKFRVFCRTAAYDVLFSNSRGEGEVPPLPSPAGAHGHTSSSKQRYYSADASNSISIRSRQMYVKTRNVCNGNISNVGALHFSILLFVRVSRCARRVQFGRCSVIVHVFAGGWKAFPPVSSKRSVLIGGIRTCSNPVYTVTSRWNVITSKSTVTVLSWPPALFSIANSSRRSKTDYWVTSYTSKTRAMT